MLVERAEVTVDRFINFGWSSTEIERNRLVAELLSVSNETNRRIDSSHYLVREGLLIDPETNRPILQFIAPGVEYKVAEDLQGWANESSDGIAWWISPELEGVYPCNKAMIYQIAYDLYGNKSVLNSAILFDGYIKSPEDLRRTLFTDVDEDEVYIGILRWIEEVSGEKIDRQSVSHDSEINAEYFADKIRAGTDSSTIVDEMKSSGFIGNFSVSCPLSFSDFTSANANLLIFSVGKDKYGDRRFKCPRTSCGKMNTRPFGKLISHCKYCGADVSCR